MTPLIQSLMAGNDTLSEAGAKQAARTVLRAAATRLAVEGRPGSAEILDRMVKELGK